MRSKKKAIFVIAAVLLAGLLPGIGIARQELDTGDDPKWDCFVMPDHPCACPECWINNCYC